MKTPKHPDGKPVRKAKAVTPPPPPYKIGTKVVGALTNTKGVVVGGVPTRYNGATYAAGKFVLVQFEGSQARFGAIPVALARLKMG